ncbi:riboflavin kinase-like, partial [Oppia nitens]|uniref:riboflavin kinase-like n=1 Tax=Oppia nitens TaxID=1686743 RepID=UPI0023DA1D90
YNMQTLIKPYLISGKVVAGFGRGSKQLGIPTANIDTDVVQQIPLKDGVYCGFCQLIAADADAATTTGPNQPPVIYPMVCSLGLNPQFGTTLRSLEVHILHEFADDFYGHTLRTAICGHIRDQQKFTDLQQLIDCIHNDIAIAKQELLSMNDQNRWSMVLNDEFFR